MPSLMWFQTGACGGDTLALLSAEDPDLGEFIERQGIELLWHPSLSHQPTSALARLIGEIEDGSRPLDILCVEGSIVTGPNGSGMHDVWRGRPKMDITRALAAKARWVVAMGTCAAFGGVHAAPPNPSDCIGLQYAKQEPGGLLGADWRSASGQPVINVAGCPAHPQTMIQTLEMLALGMAVELDELNRPKAFFSTVVHQGCTRNEYHEFDIEDVEPGGRGCLFFNLGCQGPLTQAPCNQTLWNGRSSKTRAGVPCFGCTSPDFPRNGDLFRTEKLGDVPMMLPLGVERPGYMAYKNLANAAAPKRLVDRDMEP